MRAVKKASAMVFGLRIKRRELPLTDMEKAMGEQRLTS
jgi:hypothetical protein